ncbi:MAG: ABC transporter substrate-binding protein, partial [Candidatus Rokubacteria bacterium]|nr:ABC transporter substrate-binding protein [Candidatus Rokubacteria bacterium]
MRRYLAILLGVALAVAGLGAPASANHDIVIGLQCDRTGATQTVGVVLCPGYHDYIALVNSKGGVNGHKLKAVEIDHEYKVPQGMEAYERHKK